MSELEKEEVLLKIQRRLSSLNLTQANRLLNSLDKNFKPRGVLRIYPDIVITRNFRYCYSFSPERGEYFLSSKKPTRQEELVSLDPGVCLTFNRKQGVLSVLSGGKTKRVEGVRKFDTLQGGEIWVDFKDGKQEVFNSCLQSVNTVPREVKRFNGHREVAVTPLVSNEKFIAVRNMHKTLYIFSRRGEATSGGAEQNINSGDVKRPGVRPLKVIKTFPQVKSQAIVGRLLFFIWGFPNTELAAYDLEIGGLVQVPKNAVPQDSNTQIIGFSRDRIGIFHMQGATGQSILRSPGSVVVYQFRYVSRHLRIYNMHEIQVFKATFSKRICDNAFLTKFGEVYVGNTTQSGVLSVAKGEGMSKIAVLPTGAKEIKYPSHSHLRKIGKSLIPGINPDITDIILGFCVEQIN